jgi:hypothetical protein
MLFVADPRVTAVLKRVQRVSPQNFSMRQQRKSQQQKITKHDRIAGENDINLKIKLVLAIRAHIRSNLKPESKKQLSWQVSTRKSLGASAAVHQGRDWLPGSSPARLSRHATSERLVACASGRARLLWCKMRLPARPAGNVGIERFCRARPARCRLGCASCMRGESSGARTTRAPRQPNSFPAWPCCMRPGN